MAADARRRPRWTATPAQPAAHTMAERARHAVGGPRLWQVEGKRQTPGQPSLALGPYAPLSTGCGALHGRRGERACRKADCRRRLRRTALQNFKTRLHGSALLTQEYLGPPAWPGGSPRARVRRQGQSGAPAGGQRADQALPSLALPNACSTQHLNPFMSGELVIVPARNCRLLGQGIRWRRHALQG